MGVIVIIRYAACEQDGINFENPRIHDKDRRSLKDSIAIQLQYSSSYVGQVISNWDVVGSTILSYSKFYMLFLVHYRGSDLTDVSILRRMSSVQIVSLRFVQVLSRNNFYISKICYEITMPRFTVIFISMYGAHNPIDAKKLDKYSNIILYTLFHCCIFSVNRISTLADFSHCLDLEELYIRKNNISELSGKLEHMY